MRCSQVCYLPRISTENVICKLLMLQESNYLIKLNTKNGGWEGCFTINYQFTSIFALVYDYIDKICIAGNEKGCLDCCLISVCLIIIYDYDCQVKQLQARVGVCDRARGALSGSCAIPTLSEPGSHKHSSLSARLFKQVLVEGIRVQMLPWSIETCRCQWKQRDKSSLFESFHMPCCSNVTSKRCHNY